MITGQNELYGNQVTHLNSTSHTSDELLKQVIQQVTTKLQHSAE
jgi:hypothetical protein